MDPLRVEGRAPSQRARCPVLVGRSHERLLLESALARAADGRGTVVALRGEAGIGKTRLARAALDAAGGIPMAALVGRCAEQGRSSHRPLIEALCGAARAGGLPAAPALQPFRHALGVLVPDWRTSESADEASPVLLGEGILRLCRHLGGRGALLVVDDLHWADPDTLAVLEYVADNVEAFPLVLLVTLRPERRTGAAELLSRLEARGAAQVVDLLPLAKGEVAEMVAACAGQLGDGLVDLVHERAEGLPLLVEELLSSPSRPSSTGVPASFVDAVAARLAAVPADAVLTVQCAALLGRRFDWRLLPAVSALEEERVRRALEQAVEVQLLVTEADGGLAFRHALVRDAVVSLLLPPTRVALARRAAAAVGDGDALLAADLWLAADEPAAAASRLVHAGRRATGDGALTTAERLLRSARALPVDDAQVRIDVAEALTGALALAAKVDDALAVGTEALDLLAREPAGSDRRARLHLALARSAVDAGRWPLAEQHVAAGRSLLSSVGDEHLEVELDAVASHVALGEGRPAEARTLATSAAARAEALGLPGAACDALEVLGRLQRLHDLRGAAARFERAHDLARSSGLALRSVRALHELGTIDMFERAAPERLLQASEMAYEAGALSLAATVDLQLVGLHGFRFEVDDAVAVGARALEVASALDLREVVLATHLQLAFAHAVAGRRPAMEEALRQALEVAGERAEVQALAWGHARATASLLAEDRPRAMEELDVALRWTRSAPGVTGAFSALSALLRVLEGAGPEAIDDVRLLDAQGIPMNAAVISFAEAVLVGRSGDLVGARAAAEAADAALGATGLVAVRHLVRRLVAGAAITDGWKDPSGWLTGALSFFSTSGHDRLAAACRDLLRSTGAPVPRAADAALPEVLRVAGVSAREAEVLDLVGERLTNREIADRLYLSPRTVEKHVERLLQKLHLGNRAELGHLARTSLP